jgi:hypothetical protein
LTTAACALEELKSLASGTELCNKNCLDKTFLLMCDAKGGELMIGKKIVLISGISLFTLTLAIAGCGKKEEPAPPPPPPPPATEPAPAPAPAEPAPATPTPGGDAGAPATGEKAPETKDEAKTK